MSGFLGNVVAITEHLMSAIRGWEFQSTLTAKYAVGHICFFTPQMKSIFGLNKHIKGWDNFNYVTKLNSMQNVLK